MTTFLFNGTDLSGWRGDPRYWSVVDGCLRARSDGAVPASTYLLTEGQYRNFRLRLQVRQTVGDGYATMHSAVAVLGEVIHDPEPPAGTSAPALGYRGPLLMFCHDWGIWEAHGRERLVPAGHPGAWRHPAERVGGWNDIEVVVSGDRVQMAANGERVVDVTDEPGRLRPGPIGLQLHAERRPQEYWFRRLTLESDPAPELLSLR